MRLEARGGPIAAPASREQADGVAAGDTERVGGGVLAGVIRAGDG